jgi:hypothetical protein
MADPRIEQRDYDDVVAEVELVLLPAVCVSDRKRIIGATYEIARLLGLEGMRVEELEALAEAFGVKK